MLTPFTVYCSSHAGVVLPWHTRHRFPGPEQESSQASQHRAEEDQSSPFCTQSRRRAQASYCFPEQGSRFAEQVDKAEAAGNPAEEAARHRAFTCEDDKADRQGSSFICFPGFSVSEHPRYEGR